MACCSREAFVSLCTEGTQHELLLQYCGECHIYEKRSWLLNWLLSMLLFPQRKDHSYESSESRALTGMRHEIWHCKNLNIAWTKGEQLPLSEHSFIKMLWQGMHLLLNNWLLEVVDLTQQESLPPFSAPLAWWQSLWALCWHTKWEIVWLYLQGKWFFAAVWLLNRSYFIRCFCCTVKNCLLLSTWSVSQPICLCYCTMERKNPYILHTVITAFCSLLKYILLFSG